MLLTQRNEDRFRLSKQVALLKITGHSIGGFMKHRTILKTLAIYIIAFICQSFTIAQPKDRPMPCPVPPEEIVKDLKKELNLTSEQEAKIQKIFESQSEEMERMFESAKKERELKREEMKKEHEATREKIEKQRKETDAKISAVLTDEQKKKFEERQKNHSQRQPRMPKPENENDQSMHEECPDHQE